MSKIELVRQALRELGDTSSQEVSTFIEQRHGVRIEARLIPVLRASILGQEMLERARQAARAATRREGNSDRNAEVKHADRAVLASPQ